MMRQGGFALMATLWLLVGISALTLEFGLESRLLRTAVANRVEGARSTAAAEAGLELARAELTRLAESSRTLLPSEPLDPWVRLDDRMSAPRESLGDARYEISVRDLGGLLNVNVATELELRRFFTALAIDDGRADRLAQAIMDWKDPDDLRRARGAEGDAYLEAGRRRLPRNGALASVDELRDVMGMTSDLFERIAPLLTVAGSGRVNLASAPVPVLSALPGMEPALIEAVLDRRRRGPIGSIVQIVADLPPGQRAVFEARIPDLLARTTTATTELEVISTGWYEPGITRSRARAILVRTGSAVFFYPRGLP